MTDVHVTYRLIQPAGHHRQPRSSSSSVELLDLGTGPEIPGASGTQNAPAVYDSNHFHFWSVSDGTGGFTTDNRHLAYQVSSQTMELTAWYLPPGGIGPDGGSAFLIDAFSVAANDFVDNDFVTVTSDPSLTSQANVAGVIPTARSGQTAEAFGTINAEGFEQWIGASRAIDREARFDKGANGFAIATYKKGEGMKLPEINEERQWLLLLGGVIYGGGGIGIQPGGGPVPIDPWGPMLERLVRGIQLTAMGAQLKGTAAAQIRKIGGAEIAAAGEAFTKQASRLQR